ncbi:MAG: hypothetical protein ABI980_07460 [Nitrospirota bacterium]
MVDRDGAFSIDLAVCQYGEKTGSDLVKIAQVATIDPAAAWQRLPTCATGLDSGSHSSNKVGEFFT